MLYHENRQEACLKRIDEERLVGTMCVREMIEQFRKGDEAIGTRIIEQVRTVGGGTPARFACEACLGAVYDKSIIQQVAGEPKVG